jgi:hypothetical protein
MFWARTGEAAKAIGQAAARAREASLRIGFSFGEVQVVFAGAGLASTCSCELRGQAQ